LTTACLTGRTAFATPKGKQNQVPQHPLKKHPIDVAKTTYIGCAASTLATFSGHCRLQIDTIWTLLSKQ
jgi:hypothetical protein